MFRGLMTAFGVVLTMLCVTQTWGQQTEDQKLTASDCAAYDWLGWPVSISGDTALIGAYGNDDKGNTSGSAYVFPPVSG